MCNLKELCQLLNSLRKFSLATFSTFLSLLCEQHLEEIFVNIFSIPFYS